MYIVYVPFRCKYLLHISYHLKVFAAINFHYILKTQMAQCSTLKMKPWFSHYEVNIDFIVTFCSVALRKDRNYLQLKTSQHPNLSYPIGENAKMDD